MRLSPQVRRFREIIFRVRLKRCGCQEFCVDWILLLLLRHPKQTGTFSDKNVKRNRTPQTPGRLGPISQHHTKTGGNTNPDSAETNPRTRIPQQKLPSAQSDNQPPANANHKSPTGVWIRPPKALPNRAENPYDRVNLRKFTSEVSLKWSRGFTRLGRVFLASLPEAYLQPC